MMASGMFSGHWSTDHRHQIAAQHIISPWHLGKVEEKLAKDGKWVGRSLRRRCSRLAATPPWESSRPGRPSRWRDLERRGYLRQDLVYVKLYSG